MAVSFGNLQGQDDDGEDGEMTKEWLTQGEIDDHIRRRVVDQLTATSPPTTGSPVAAKEILRGLAAAATMGIDLGARSRTRWPSATPRSSTPPDGARPRGVPGA